MKLTFIHNNSPNKKIMFPYTNKKNVPDCHMFAYTISNTPSDDDYEPRASVLKIDKIYSDINKSGRITTHYSATELLNLYEAANRVCKRNESSPTLTLLKRQSDYQKRTDNVVMMHTHAHSSEQKKC
ncbi:hypothetical protein CbuG_0992 [Coxiella burnetii CbuG_Q212]|nr:hypothetical protein CbuG_0992 [Coxiella burnetii CbuG_Q212]